MPLTYAVLETISSTEQILSSDRIWEDRLLLEADEICPDLLAEALGAASHALLEESTRRQVALDWSTLRVYVHTSITFGEHTLVTRVDVL